MVGVCDGRWVGEPVVHGLWCQRSPICEVVESISRWFVEVTSTQGVTTQALRYQQRPGEMESAPQVL